MWQVSSVKTITQAPKFLRACLAADILDGKCALSPTIELVASVCKVSPASVSRARRLDPEQRAAVRRGDRPLVIPRSTAQTPPADPRQRVGALVDELGVEVLLSLVVEHQGGERRFTWWQLTDDHRDAA
jgi:hypothetical protein